MAKKTKWFVRFTFEGEAEVFAETFEEARSMVQDNFSVAVGEEFWDHEADYKTFLTIGLTIQMFNDDGTVVEEDDDGDTETEK